MSAPRESGVTPIKPVWIIFVIAFVAILCGWLFTVLDTAYPTVAPSGPASPPTQALQTQPSPSTTRTPSPGTRTDRAGADPSGRTKKVSCTKRGDRRPYCWHWEDVQDWLDKRDYLSAWNRCLSVKHLLGEERDFWALCIEAADGFFPKLVRRVEDIRDGRSFQHPHSPCSLLLEKGKGLSRRQQDRFEKLCEEANAATRDPKRAQAVRPDCERAARDHTRKGGRLDRARVSGATSTIGPEGGVVGLDNGVLLPIPPGIAPSPLPFGLTPNEPEGDLMKNAGWEPFGASFQVSAPVHNSNGYVLCVYGGELPAGRSAEDLMLLIGSWGIADGFERSSDGTRDRKVSSRTYMTTPRKPDEIQGRFALFRAGPSFGPAVYQPALRRR